MNWVWLQLMLHLQMMRLHPLCSAAIGIPLSLVTLWLPPLSPDSTDSWIEVGVLLGC